MTAPIPFRWDGEAMVPVSARFAVECDRAFVVGETYKLVEHQDRSANSHRHYFAEIREAWVNLPEHLAERFPSEDHLRKWALIKAGYANNRSIVCASKAEAQRVASFIKPMDEFAVVTVSEAVVTVWTAQSQSMRAMGKKVFQESKQAVLDIVSELIGTTPGALARNTREAA